MMMYIMSPRYEIKKTLFTRIFGYTYKVIFRYAIEIESPCCRGAKEIRESRGYFKSKEDAMLRMNELERNPDWCYK